MQFDESTNFNFILRSKTRHCYLETRAANVWELTQKSELNLND